MMAINKLLLPTNFGLEDLYEPSNNNAAFVLANGDRFGAASLMLGFHSPVLKNKYIKAGILDIDAVEFSRPAVKVFVEAMYCGELDVNRENFREVNKMCHAFDVTWMSGKCLQYYEQAVQIPDSHDSNEDLKFLFEEAVYFSEHGSSGSLLGAWKRNTGEEKFSDFINKYLETKSDVHETTLKILMTLTTDHSIFIKKIRGKISETLPTLDNASRFLILNINLVDYFDEYALLITEIFDILLDNEESADCRMFTKLYRRVTKEYLVQNSSKRVCSRSEVAGPTHQKIPNLFHEKLTSDGSYRTLESVVSVSRNLYMVLEYLAMQHVEITSSRLRELEDIKKQRGWEKISNQFIGSLSGFSKNSKDALTNCGALVSDNDTVRTVFSDERPTGWDFFTKRAFYRFYMKPRHQRGKDTEYGFIIEVTGQSRKNPDVFDIKLVLETDKYRTEDMNLPDDFSADRMHVTLKFYGGVITFGRPISYRGNHPFSWSDKPAYGDDGKIMWGGKSFADHQVGERFVEGVQLVIYYSLSAAT